MVDIRVRNVPEELYKRIKLQACINGRSISQEAVYQITKYYEKDKSMYDILKSKKRKPSKKGKHVRKLSIDRIVCLRK